MPGSMPSDLPAFKAHPLYRGGHLQTIAPLLYKPPTGPAESTCHIVDLRDADQLAVIEDCPANWKPGGRSVIALHGLSGTHQSHYVVRLTHQMLGANRCVFRPDMRGFGDSTLISRGHCNAGAYDDLADVVEWVSRRNGRGPITLVGYSLGANILLQYLARDPDQVSPCVDSAVAVAPPIDLLHCAWNLRRGLNRIYDWSFVRSLHTQLRLRRQRVPELRDLDLQRLPNRLLQFDDQYTSLVCGYRGAKHYYAECSSADLLHRIQVPTNILISRDDPLIPTSMFTGVRLAKGTRVVSTPTGGHLGYISNDPKAERAWLDTCLSNWILQLDQAATFERPAQSTESMPEQLIASGIEASMA